ncbi:MAG: hypothetical protein ACFFBP_08990 [Promethearchaeota archaeon]
MFVILTIVPICPGVLICYGLVIWRRSWIFLSGYPLKRTSTEVTKSRALKRVFLSAF